MAKRAGTYKGEKRRKELSRLKKQEEKRQRRLAKKSGANESDETDTEGLTDTGEPEKSGDSSADS